MTSIIVQNISKSFSEVKAVSDVNFKVEKGELFGLIGPDGAGKTTLFKMLTSLLIPDSGNAYVQGFHTVKDYKSIRKIIGYMPGTFSLYQDLTVEENLNFFATIFGTSLKENYDLIEEIYVQIEPFKKRPAGKLSGGMKQKLALCCALIHEPEVLFLDEPTTGVDAVSRAEFWEMLQRIKAKGISILVSTPYMDEATMCDRIALIQSGEIMQINTPYGITEEFDKPLFSLKSQNLYKLLLSVRNEAFCERAEPFGEFLHLTTSNIMSVSELTHKLNALGHDDVEAEKITATIEDVFLDLMQTKKQ